MNSPRIIRELEALSRFLHGIAYLPKTAAAVLALRNVDLKATKSDAWHPQLVDVYRDEVRNSLNFIGEPDPDHHQALLDGMDQVMIGAATNPQAWSAYLATVQPVVEAIGESHGNTRELYNSFIAPTSTPKHVFINLCLMYLILCEGVFPNQARLLLGFRSVSRGKVTDARPLTPPVLAQKLQEADMDAFAAGYSRNIRNSIAHGHFRYDPNSGMMRFRDYSYHQGRISLNYDESWHLDKFGSQFAKMDDVYLVVSTYLQIYSLPTIREIDCPQGHAVH